MITDSLDINELLRLLAVAKSSQVADTEVAHLVASFTNEQCLVLDKHELETTAIPQMERAQNKMRSALANHDLRQIERAQWSVECAQGHIDRVMRRLQK